MLFTQPSWDVVDGNGETERENCGALFIVLGRPGLLDGGLIIDTRDPPDGVITIAGGTVGERAGIWVETGDLDGDGIQDRVTRAKPE